MTDKLEISHNDWSAEGLVKSVNDESVSLVIHKDKKPSYNINRVKVKYIWGNTSYQRMRLGLEKLSDKLLCSEKLEEALLYPPRIDFNKASLSTKFARKELNRIQGNKLPKLNEAQLKAVSLGLSKHPIVLIQGPPGTGKTVTLAAILYLLASTKKKTEKILLSAPSNVAVDHLTERMIDLGMNVSRVYARTREIIEEIPAKLKSASLHEQVRNWIGSGYKRLRQLQALKDDDEWLSDKEEREYIKLQRKAEKDILTRVDIICCTCITAGDLRVSADKYPYVVIDEAAQALEPESLLPILMGAKKIIFAGDHKQLGPVVTSQPAKKLNFGRSLFERLAVNITPLLLVYQYRMHPAIMDFPSKIFYEGELRVAAGVSRPINSNIPWSNPMKPIMFYNVQGIEETPTSGHSLLNRLEATIVKQILNRLMNSSIKPINIGVITPYVGQKKLLELMKKTTELPNQIEIASVDGFQGREKDYIVISCVRSNEELGIGFLTDEKRINVALTRAKYGLIICGNAGVLAKKPIWKKLLTDYVENKFMVENGFKPFNFRIPE